MTLRDYEYTPAPPRLADLEVLGHTTRWAYVSANNYFKVVSVVSGHQCHAVFTFQDEDEADTARAYDLAQDIVRKCGGERCARLSVWSVPIVRGDWTWVPRITGPGPLEQGAAAE
jgi:hypothetical protein